MKLINRLVEAISFCFFLYLSILYIWENKDLTWRNFQGIPTFSHALFTQPQNNTCLPLRFGMKNFCINHLKQNNNNFIFRNTDSHLLKETFTEFELGIANAIPNP